MLRLFAGIVCHHPLIHHIPQVLRINVGIIEYSIMNKERKKGNMLPKVINHSCSWDLREYTQWQTKTILIQA